MGARFATWCQLHDRTEVDEYPLILLLTKTLYYSYYHIVMQAQYLETNSDDGSEAPLKLH